MTSKEAVLELICEAKSVNIDEERICFLRNIIEKDLGLLEKLEKAFDKACERLDWGCPEEQNLIDDFIDYFDCENCKNTEKECWKKYFLKEVLENEKVNKYD